MSLPMPPGGNSPRIALTAAAALFGMVVVLTGILAVTGKLDERATPLVVSLMGVVATVVPGLIAATYAERASRDIRNGTVVDKAREGAVQAFADPEAMAKVREATGHALEDKQIVTRTGPVITAELAALTEILSVNREIRDAVQAPPQHRA